jgi:hypothetical protein
MATDAKPALSCGDDMVSDLPKLLHIEEVIRWGLSGRLP